MNQTPNREIVDEKSDNTRDLMAIVKDAIDKVLEDGQTAGFHPKDIAGAMLAMTDNLAADLATNAKELRQFYDHRSKTAVKRYLQRAEARNKMAAVAANG